MVSESEFSENRYRILQIRLPELIKADTVHLLVHLIQHIQIRRIGEYRYDAADGDEDTESQSHTGQPDPGYTHAVHALSPFPGQQCKENTQCTGGNGQQSGTAQYQRTNAADHGSNGKASETRVGHLVTPVHFVILFLILIIIHKNPHFRADR